MPQRIRKQFTVDPKVHEAVLKKLARFKGAVTAKDYLGFLLSKVLKDKAYDEAVTAHFKK